MRRRVLRGLAISAMAVVLLAIAVLLVIHTNPVQSRVLGWSIAELESRFDLDLTAGNLHYNLASRHVVLTDVRLAAIGQRDNPFFLADRVAVDLPWTVFRGQLLFDRVQVDRGVVTITRDANGESNLPPGRGARPPDAPARVVNVRALAIDRLDFLYQDRRRDIEIAAPGVRTDLAYEAGEGARGPFAIAGGVTVRIDERTVRIEPVQGRMVFDGSDVELADVRLNTTDGDLLMSGAIDRALDRPTLNLSFTGTSDLDRVARWTDPPVPLDGPVAFAFTMTGAPSEFVMDARVTSGGASVGRERGVRIDADARLTPDGVSVAKSTLTPATGGTITATLDVPFGDENGWWIAAGYRGLDAAAAFRLADLDPLPFGAALSGTARIEAAAGQPFNLEVRNTSTPRRAQGTAPIEGEVDFFVAGSRWRANQRHRMGATRVDGEIGGIWNRDAVTRSTFDGTLDVATGDVGEALGYAALFGLGTPEFLQDATGPLEADVRMDGVFVEPRFTGTASTPGLVIPAIGRTAFTADFDASERAVHATNVEATIESSTRLVGDVHADLETRRLDGELRIETPSAAELLTALPETLRLDGPLQATAAIGGTVDSPLVTTEVSGTGLTLAGEPIQSLTAKARIVDEGITVDAFELVQGEGVLRGAGRYDWETRTYTVDLEGRDLTWRGPVARLGDAEARFAVKFAGSGSIDRPVGEGVVEFDVSGGLAGDLISKGIANVRLNGETALVTARVPSLGAFITASIEPRAPFPYDAVVVMHRVDLKPLATLAGLEAEPIAGTMSLSASAKGVLSSADENRGLLADSRAFVNLQDIQAEVAGVPVRLALPSRVSWDGTALTIDTLDVTVGGGRLHASGRLGPGGLEEAKWDSTFTGELGDLLKIGRPFGVPGDLDGRGPIEIAWQSAGGIDRSTGRAHLENGTLTWGALPSVRDLALDAAFDGKTLDLTRLTGQWQDGGIEATASIPRAVLEARDAGPALPSSQAGFAKLRVVGLSEAALAPWLDEEILTAIDGRVSATLDARITRAALEGVAGTVTFDEADFTLAGVKVAQVRPAVLDVQGGLVTLKDVAFDAGGSPLTIAGTVRVAPADQQQLDLDVQGTADLRIISAFAPTVATDGDAKISVGIGGPLARPVFNGRIDVADAEMAIRDPRILVSQMSGTIALDGQRVLFDSLRGTANGGDLQLDGGFLLEGFQPSSGGLTAVVDGAALEYPEGLQSEADALVTLRPGPTGWTLIGDIHVVRSAYTEPISLAGLIAAQGTRTPTAGAEASWVERLRLNLFVNTQQDLRLDNNYGRLEAGAAIRVAGTVAEPVLAGRVTLREGGEVYLAGNTFHVARGSISFTNPHRIVPEFDIELRTLVGGSDISVTLEGPLDRLETDVRSSDPAVDSREAIAMLFGGTRGEDAVALLSAELLGATGRAIGLDALRVERGFSTDEFRADPGLIATETDPSARLTLSKRLRPDVELILSQSLRQSGGLSAIVNYRPRRNIELRAVSRDNVDRALGIRHEITFGGAGTPDFEAAERPEIAATTISGDPGRPPEAILSTLDLTAGDEFDFHTWQKDLDEIRESYHELDHYEVRVRGTRQASDDGKTVTLDYRIEPGPVAELVIEGHPLEPELEEDIREAWMRTIFDRFLLEDIRSRILSHLMEEDMIGAAADVTIGVSTPERKQIRVTVTPGISVSRRTIEYSGNAAIEADRLDTVVANAGLEVDGWLDTRRLAGTLQDFYRRQGFLTAVVSAEPPAVRGTRGVLPVSVIEGRRFVIGRLTLPGVSPNRLADVAAAVRLDSDVPFVTEEIDAARRRVEDLYADEGFNTVQIEVDSAPDLEAGTVAVEVAILEGLQQVLREVTTEGATRTRDGVIRRSLRLRIGEPVNLADWAQARKRLYDTNVFRQVDIEPVPIESTVLESAAGVQPVRAVVRVVEYPVWRLRYGLQVNDEQRDTPDPDGDTRLQSVGILADLQNQNLFGRAITAGIAGRYERSRQAASLFLSNSSFFGLPIRSNGFLFTSRQRFEIDEFESIDRTVGLSAEQRWRPFRYSEVIWGYRLERTQVLGDFPLDALHVARLNAAALLDRRDDPSDPKRGWLSVANWDQAVEALGSDYGNGKLLLQHSQFQGFGRLVLAGRAQIGSGYGEQALIRSERFLLGGATTVRGYGENTLGPRDFLDLPAGGDALLALNAEARFPVRGWVQGVVFFDAGNVFETRGDVSLRDLAHGYGLGLRLASPFAMLRVDFGIPGRTIRPDRPANQFKSGRWYFGIGHIF